MRAGALLLPIVAGLCLLGPATVVQAAPSRLPSLAKINGWLDEARTLEQKKSWERIPGIYAAVLTEIGEPVPRHLIHVAAKAYVQTGHAQLALGKLDEAQAAYQSALDRFGKSYELATRGHVGRARAVIGRIAEIRKMMPGAAPKNEPTPGLLLAPLPPPATSLPPPASTGSEPLILLTDRTGKDREGHDDTKGFEVRSFDGDEASLIRDAERRATPAGRKVLQMGRDMATIRKDILPGSCWDWVNAVFNRAGYPQPRRDRCFKSVKKGPYARPHQVQPGDWMYYRNRSYGNIEHSGIFVGWINAPQQVALVLSYPGMQRQEPGRYRPYELTGIWSIFRPTG